MNTNVDNRGYLNQKELAAWLGRTTRYVAKLAAKRIIPEIRLSGKCRMYDREKVRMALARFETNRFANPRLDDMPVR